MEFDDVWFAWDDTAVLRGVSFTVPRGRLRMLLGASGSGKSTMLKLTLGLLHPDSGRVLVNGERIDTMREADLLRVRSEIGIVFQENAPFDSLTVSQNVGFRLDDEARLPEADIEQRVAEVLGFVGLVDFGDRLPSELSGGQRRRVGMARAMASRPGLLLFDDPTTGLDPIISTSVCDEIVKLRDLEQVTAIFVTHQIRDAFYVATHRAVREGSSVRILPADGTETAAEFMVLRDGHIVFEGTAPELLAVDDPYLREYLYQTLPPW